MTNYDAKKEWDKKNMAIIAIKAKKDMISDIKKFSADAGFKSPAKFLLSMYYYCMENNVNIDDLKKYEK